ncbi:MAG: ATP-binding cassette domain-containing protein [Firmicutes bacterium]|nr:ATP-binding cassette domain-containing protein [Bacillota bacterium]
MLKQEPLPADIARELEERGLNLGRIRLVLASDLDETGRFGESWLIVDDSKVWAVFPQPAHPPKVAVEAPPGTRSGQPPRRPSGPPPAPPGTAPGSAPGCRVRNARVLALKDLESLHAENLVGSGVLLARSLGEEILLIRYTRALSRRFGQAAGLIEKLRKGEDFSEADLKDEGARLHCPKCGQPYPEPERRICPRCLDRRSLFRRVLSFVPEYRWHISLILFLMLVSSGLRLLSPYVGGRVLFDHVLAPGGRYEGRIGAVVLAIFATQLAAILISIAYGRLNAEVAARATRDLKVKVFSAMQGLSLSFYNNKQTGALMTRVDHDALMLQYFFSDGVPYFIVNSFTLLGISLAMIWLDWRLSLLVLLPSPAVVVVVRRLYPRLWRLFSRRFRASAGLNAVVNDALTGIKVVKAFGKEDQEINRFASRNETVFNVSVEAGNLSSTAFPLVSLLVATGGLLIWAVGGWQVVSHRVSFGTLMTFVQYVAMFYGPLEFMTHVVDWWTSCMNSAQRIFEVIDATPEVVEHPQPVRRPRIEGAVCLSGVTFGYDKDRPVLTDVNLDVKAGEMIGLVGHSGAGKSTLMNLVSRLYDADSGSVRVDGHDVRNLSVTDLREQVGIVPQETFLFSGTVAENIAYSRPEATPLEIIVAARIANAHDFVSKLPDGYDTRLGRRGQDLSGGERQRLAIARAILHNPRILILDEATGAVDTETERKIQEALERLVRGRTTFAIAHRLSTLRNADRLLVIEKGKNVECGTHEELVRKKGAYHKLLRAQREALKVRGVE